MEIIRYKIKSTDELINKLRRVTMLKDQSVKPYLNAHISVIDIDPECLSPCQFYILKDELDSKIELQEAFKDINQDIFNISGYIEFQISTENSYRTLLPPVIEESIENDCRIYHLINDGMHRIFLSKLQKRRSKIILIRGANVKYYAYPLPNGWHDVKIVNKIDKGLIKKIHRIRDNKRLYRNFDSVFMNCSRPRGIISNGN